jgi:hypothetical protein
MFNNKKRPCIRNMAAFKKGCPEKCWDGREGCPAWTEITLPKPDNPAEKEIIKNCLDIFMFRMQWDSLGLLEGNQRAVETFRNGMTVSTTDGRTVPKPDPALQQLVLLLKDMKRTHEKQVEQNMIDQRIQKQIEDHQGSTAVY